MKKVSISALLISVFVFSCEKSELPTATKPLNEAPNNFSKIKHIGEITDKDTDRLHGRVSTFYEILKGMYTDDIVIDEVNDFISTGYYSDENIVVADLLNPERSEMAKNARKASSNVFKKSFEVFLSKNQNARISADLTDYIIANGVSIYFPYSDKHKGKKMTDITLVMPPKDDTNEAEGIRITKCGNNICEQKVKVNDAYAIKNPTHIIYAGGADIKITYNSTVKNGRVSAVNSVYVGAVKCRKQYDALISFTGNGGGSEIKFFRGSGYLSLGSNNQIQSVTGDVISSNFSRSQISNCNFQIINASWDIDWKEDNIEQVFGIYEEDTQGTKTFTGSVSTTLKNGQNQNYQGSIGYSISVQTQDEIIRNWKINRESFYIVNSQSQGYGVFTTIGGLTGGPWAAWDGGVGVGDCSGANVGFVLPTKTF